MKYDVFISHSSKDLDISLQVCEYLESQGLKCWIDSRNITGSYARSIIEGIEFSEVMLLIYSGKSNDSMHVENEIDNAFGYGKIIIPFRIEKVPYSQVLQYYLSKTHYVDGLPRPMEAFEELLCQIKRNLTHQQKIEAINESIGVLSEWINIPVAILRHMLATMKKGMEMPDLSQHICDLTSVFSSRVQELMEESNQPQTAENVAEAEVSVEKDEEKGGSYNIFSKENGDLLLIVKGDFSDEPENPRLVYDGGDSALYYRSRKSSMVLNKIAVAARGRLMSVDSLTVAEMTGDEDFIRDMIIPVRKVPPVL